MNTFNNSSCTSNHKCNTNLSNKWSELSYAGECRVPQGEEVQAYSWSLCFLKKSSEGLFTDSQGNIVPLDIKEPDLSFNIDKEYEYLVNVMENVTPIQEKIAEYWGDGPPTKQFMPILDILVDTYGVPACRACRMFFILNGALNDACAITWFLKYKWDILRPNQYNQCLRPLLCTPKHPSYPSGHSALAGCMAEILSYFFPAESEKLDFLAQQCSDSRIFGGVHYQADCDEGLTLGRSIAKAILVDIETQTNDNGVKIDIPYVEFKDADIIPKKLEQYIPYDRGNNCSSLTQ